MKKIIIKCPHCGNSLKEEDNAYLYGSPFRVCSKCKNTYVDNRYHEIAIEGIRQEDINPTEADMKAQRKSGWKWIWIGIGMNALFIIILFTGWMIFPLPIFGVSFIISGSRSIKNVSPKQLEKKRKEIEAEKQQSLLRIQNPEYLEQLRTIGYNIPFSEQSAPVQQPQQKICASCGTHLDENDRFCPKCGTPN